MTRLTPVAAAAALLQCAPATAEDGPAAAATAPAFTLHGGGALVSDYRFRGISLSANHPALQASFTLAHRSGAYAGVWGSTLDGFGVLGGSHLELDLTAGYRATVGKAALDGGLLYYVYPGNKGGPFEFFEPYASVAAPLGRLNARASLAYAPKQVAIGRANLYTALDLALPIARTPLTLNAHAGRSHGRSTLSPGGGYLDWSAGAQARSARRRSAWHISTPAYPTRMPPLSPSSGGTRGRASWQPHQSGSECPRSVPAKAGTQTGAAGSAGALDWFGIPVLHAPFLPKVAAWLLVIVWRVPSPCPASP